MPLGEHLVGLLHNRVAMGVAVGFSALPLVGRVVGVMIPRGAMPIVFMNVIVGQFDFGLNRH
jgi:hypothetical protein